MLLFFFFLGFICNSSTSHFQKDPGNKLLFMYTSFVSSDTLYFDNLEPTRWAIWIEVIPLWLSIFIFVGIGIIQAYREDFLVYAVKNNLLMIPLLIVVSWIWYSINYNTLIFIVIFWYFTSLHGYLNIIVLTFFYGLAGIFGGWLKIRKNERELQVHTF